MSENNSKNNIIPRDDVPRDEIKEKGEMTGPLDVPQEEYGEERITLEVSPGTGRLRIAVLFLRIRSTTSAGRPAERS